MNQQLKFYISTLLILTTIGYIWYLSEPKYENNHHGPIQPYDIITVSDYQVHWDDSQVDRESTVETFMVLQKDSSTIFVKQLSGNYVKYKVMNYIKYDIHIIGHGTIYHKVNQIIGLNIMLIAQVLLTLILIIIVVSYLKIAPNFWP